MIRTKKDLRYYLSADKIALGISRKYPRLIGDDIWKFEILLRKTEYWANRKKRPPEQNTLLFSSLQTLSFIDKAGIFDSFECVRAGAFDRT